MKQLTLLGFDIPGVVLNNVIFKIPNICLTNLDLKKEIKKYFSDAKITVTNDANAAEIGEDLVGEKSSSSYMINFVGYIIDDKVIAGLHAAIGEICHIYIDSFHKFQCKYRLKGVLNH